MNIPLHAPIPIRLLAKSGKWLLEVERYVAVRAQLFRPRRETLEGEGAILRALSAGEEAELAETARTLMRGGTLPERCYDVVEGAFAEAALPDSIPGARATEARAHAEEQELTRMRDLLMALQMKVERLRTQMTDLEQGTPPTRQLPHRNEAAVPARGQASIPHLAGCDLLADDSASLAGRDLLADDSASLAGRDLLADDSASLAGRDLLADDASDLAGRDLLADDEPPAQVPPPALDLGTAEEHASALDALLGGVAKFTVSTADTTPGLLMIDESYFVSKIANEAGESVGALLVDGPTLKMLGAAMRKLSRKDTDAELTSDTPSEAVLGGIKELASAMIDTLARNAANPAVFACDVEKLDPVELPWLFDVQKRVDLDDSLGGHVLLVCK